MPNERLRDALMRNGLDPEQVAKALDVDQKTVERWISKGRTPYPRYRHKLAALIKESEIYLWPDAVAPERKAATATAELVQVFPHRNAVPAELWDRIIGDAASDIEILVHAGLFLIERPRFIKDLAKKANSGTSIRLVFGDPGGDSVALRGDEEQLGDGTLPARIRNALAYYKPLVGVPGVQIRFHNTTLYNSIFRFDDEMVVNTHIFGSQGAHAPALHLRRLSAGDLFESYSESFESVWNLSRDAQF
ncbi:DUF5919 domain-containing protein [Amycolatopsis sp. DSM 110486]|uniref:DUF5919 domain-containing protein n=1 Tax=Amycolatopsis sp. DSM 110486 TaxID=2865832 RepID=UPI001C6A3A33|nr:DUF5919 domain-containing protein [Amycolatopsis sp. DSM 110486]QYN22220.1 helix-turn-helix domain-containing protein [Amycolatopsis sp. DSM 110486]